MVTVPSWPFAFTSAVTDADEELEDEEELEEEDEELDDEDDEDDPRLIVTESVTVAVPSVQLMVIVTELEAVG
jgi:hypothetical protein